MRWVGQEAYMGERRGGYRDRRENLRNRDHLQ
jgi:hypothetical protein